MRVSFFGSSLVSCYWNGAATYYRGLLRALAERGHTVTFYEPDAYGRQQHRDIPDPDWCRVVVWPATAEGMARALEAGRHADLIVKASGVGVFDAELEAGVLSMRRPSNLVAFWDVDAPATLDRVEGDAADPFTALIPQYDLIFTYGGGEPVVRAYRRLGARACVPIYNALDPATHFPVPTDPRFTAELGFLGNRLPDREARVAEFFFAAAAILPQARLLLGGAGWDDRPLPDNVRYIGHVGTADHNAFNCSARAVLNVNRDSMATYGFSPPTRVFEAAGVGACLITDRWVGIEQFLEPEREILVAGDGDQVAWHLVGLGAKRARAIGAAARARVLAEHTYAHRAAQVEAVLDGCVPRGSGRMRLVVLGLSITSSWGNGHATTYRGLVRELTRAGHEVLFLERDVPWYAAHRDLPNPVFCTTRLYVGIDELQRRHGRAVADADAVILGSYVPDGAAIGDWLCRSARGVRAFYDIDTPVTLAKLARGEHDYLAPELIPQFDLYLSFTGGPTLARLEKDLGAVMARPLYCSVDELHYLPGPTLQHWDLGYLGTYSLDRQEKLESLLLEPARRLRERRFVVAGPLYPESVSWPKNVERIEHLPPPAHPAFYAAQRYTLNLTRADMVAAGWSPSVRLFEAASCGVPIISDCWAGLDEFLRPNVEILLAETGEDVVRIVRDTPETQRLAIARAARDHVLDRHSSRVRAAELLALLHEAARRRAGERRAAG